MRYMITIYGDPSESQPSSQDEGRQMMESWFNYTQELQDSGAMLAGDALQGNETATTLRFGGDGDPTVTDGPFAETKEQLGGFYLVECSNLDEALEWAKKLPATGGAAEVRPVIDFADANGDGGASQ